MSLSQGTVHGQPASGLAGDVIERLRTMFGRPQEPIALHEPLFAGHEWEYVKECLDTGWVSTAGAYVDRFERALAEVCGVPHAISVVNGTAALHIALSVAGVSRDDEVLMPTLTFAATAAAVRYCGAYPHFIDNEAQSLGLDSAALAKRLDDIAERHADGWRNRETGRRIAAILPVHIFGHPVDIDPLVKIASSYGLPLIEDAAEGIGAQYKGRHVGGDGLVATLSFNGNKILTTGGGGAVLTRDADLATRIRHLTTTARIPHRWQFEHDDVGYNYRMPNINAALGLAQLEMLDTFLDAKRALHQSYRHHFESIRGAAILTEQPWAKSNFWLNALLLDENEDRDAVLEVTNDEKFSTRPIWLLMHRSPPYRDCPRGELTCAESMERRTVCLPSSAKLGLALV